MDREDYKTHINDLLKLYVIRRSDSPHRSAAFLVNKHSEQKKGKNRMVINHKRLNDNIEDDGYDIPTKEYLLGKIKIVLHLANLIVNQDFGKLICTQTVYLGQLFLVQKGILNGL